MRVNREDREGQREAGEIICPTCSILFDYLHSHQANLLLRTLALKEQPSVVSPETGDYYLLPLVMLLNELEIKRKHAEK